MRTLTLGFFGLTLVASAMGQSWTSAYNEGLEAAKAGKWADARKAFQKARSNRPEDVSGPTNLPGPVTEARKWRGGAPYSPNFLAAYAGYRAALSGKPDTLGTSLKPIAEEFEGLLKKKQVSNEAVFFLGSIYSRTNQTDKMSGLAQYTGKANWKVDTEIIAPEELSAMATGTSSQGGGVVQTIDASKLSTYTPASSTNLGPVPYLAKKFALIIANGDNKLEGMKIGHAANDAALIKAALATNAGYNPANIELLVNANADAIKKAAAALAARMPAEGTLFFFYTGAGVSIDKRDYLAGVDAAIPTDSASMVAKSELYRPFVEKGVSIYSFYQVPRAAEGNSAFGSEDLRTGRIAQMQSTTPGDNIFSIFRDGANVGIFAGAMSEVLADLHSNAIPITEFGWQVFYKMRRGTTGTSGGGSRQTPTLPVLQLLASDSRF